MNQKKLFVKLLAVTLAAVVVLGLTGAVSGVNTASDPLVTLSYLTGTYKSNLLSEVNTAIAAKQRQLSQEFSQQADELKAAIAKTTVTPAENDFKTVTLSAGQTVQVSAGGEALLLSGAASAREAGLTDVTAGSGVIAGGALAVNHLYVSAGDCTIQASGSAKLLVKS